MRKLDAEEAVIFKGMIERLVSRNGLESFQDRVEKWGMLYAIQHSGNEIEQAITAEFAQRVLDIIEGLDPEQIDLTERVNTAREMVGTATMTDIMNDRWSGTSTNAYANAMDASARRAATNFYRQYLEF